MKGYLTSKQTRDVEMVTEIIGKFLSAFKEVYDFLQMLGRGSCSINPMWR